MIDWRIGDVVARMDMVLKIKQIELDTGEYFVRVGVWNADNEKFEYIPKEIAAVSSCQLVTFVGGVNPPSVDILVNRFRQ